MTRQVQETIRRYAMLPKGARVLCGLSGGADSAALLLCLRELGYDVCAAHLNHGLRGEQADGDEAFCRSLCERLGVDFISERCDAARAARENGQSIETAARALRYAFFRRAAAALHADHIATAHNADDNLETMLFRLIRGTGAAGLAGIPPTRGNIVRPLLETERTQIEAYLTARGQSWRTDATNLDDGCTRNRIRHHVIPALREIEPQAARHAAQTARLLREDNDCLTALAAIDGASIPAEMLRNMPQALRARAVRCLLEASGVPMGEVGAEHIRRICALAERNGGSVSLPDSRLAALRDGVIAVERLPSPPPEQALDWERPVQFGAYTIQITQKISDIHSSFKQYPISYATMKHTKLIVRTWRPSDRMILPGARGARTLKRLYAERGLSPRQRDGLPVLCCGGAVAAAAGIGTDARFLGTDGAFLWRESAAELPAQSTNSTQ